MHQDGVNSLALALTAAFCGANQHYHGLLVCPGFAGRRDGPVHPGMFVSGCAALRGDVARCSLVFSFAPSIRWRGLKNEQTIK
uniref:hypothetical protein n=1 Tax=Escherichia coli TaxID=562 RepID=UPI00155DCC88|nr:hypothetical protein [Escherichia coli]